MGRMRVDILFYAFEPGVGAEMGGVRKVLGVARGLGQAGHAVRVVVPRFVDLRAPGVEVLPYPTLGWRLLRPLSAYLGMAWVAWRGARRAPPDLLYARTSRNILPGLLAHWLGACFIFEVNGDAFGEQGWRAGVPKALTILAADWINCRLAHRVVAITPGLKTMVESRYGVPPAKVHLIPSGTDLDVIRPLDSRACRQALGLPLDSAHVIFLGLLYRHQGVQTLLAAVPEIVRQHPGTRVLIIGEGAARPALEAQARALGLGASVAFVGPVPYERVSLYLGAADCCVAPFVTRRGETSPLKLFDYMAAGRPVVASAIPAIADLVKASGAIVPVPPDDPRLLAEEVVVLLRDPRRRQLLGEAGRRYVEAHHGWPLLARQLLSLCGEGDGTALGSQ